jgi:hypothetical protein
MILNTEDFTEFTEIERKFLVQEIPFDLKKFSSKHLLQGYYYDDLIEKHMRIRKIST